MKLNEKKEVAYQSVLLFGPPKSGKTLLAGKLAQYYKLLYFDLENGYTTLTQLPEEWQQNVEVISIPDTATFPIAIETMMKVLKGGACQICEKHGKVSCALCKQKNLPTVSVNLSELDHDTIVVIDSLSQLSNSAIANVLGDKDIEYKFEFDDWRRLGSLLHFCLSHVQAAKYHCICITHESEVKMEDGKDKLVPTAGTGNFSRNTAKYFGHVVYVEVKNKSHRAASSTTFATNILTGSRTNVALETGELDLLRIFKPEMFPALEAPVAKGTVTPGTTAVSNLQAKLAAMKSGTGQSGSAK